jgi:hypothetical protein
MTIDSFRHGHEDAAHFVTAIVLTVCAVVVDLMNPLPPRAVVI